MYTNKTISDVLAYLYKNDQKELADVVLKEIRKPSEIRYIEREQKPLTIPTIGTPGVIGTPFQQPGQVYC